MKKITNDEQAISIVLKSYSLSEVDELIFKLKRFRTNLAIELKKKAERDQIIEDFLKEQSLLDPKLKFERKTVAYTRAPKYEIIDKDGNRKTWSGVGRPLREIQEALDNGARLEDFLIK